MSISFREISTPVGRLKLLASQTSLLAVLWENDPAGRVRLPAAVLDGQHEILNETETQLREYSKKQRVAFELPLAPLGTVFQKRVWLALAAIPYAETRSYSQLAQAIGSPKAYRAVGGANVQ